MRGSSIDVRFFVDNLLSDLGSGVCHRHLCNKSGGKAVSDLSLTFPDRQGKEGLKDRQDKEMCQLWEGRVKVVVSETSSKVLQL